MRSTKQPALLRSGESAAIAVACRLRESIDELPPAERFELADVWVAPTEEARATAGVVAHWARTPPAVDHPTLDPTGFSPESGEDAGAKLTKLVHDIRVWQGDPGHAHAALLIVGHDPQLAWVAHQFTREPVPIDRGELICLGYPAVPESTVGRLLDRVGRLLEGAQPHDKASDTPRWQLQWTIHPDDSKAIEAIQQKIRSKMDSAKAMGAFATALVTFVLTQAHTYAPHAATVKGGLWTGAAVLLLVAATLFFGSLFQYDMLLMPVRFWASPAPSGRAGRRGWVVARPPSSSAWVLFQNMMRIWRRTFAVATLLVLLALVVLGYAVFLPDQRKGLWWAWTSGSVMVTLGLIALLHRWIGTSRPALGTQD